MFTFVVVLAGVVSILAASGIVLIVHEKRKAGVVLLVAAAVVFVGVLKLHFMEKDKALQLEHDRQVTRQDTSNQQ